MTDGKNMEKTGRRHADLIREKKTAVNSAVQEKRKDFRDQGKQKERQQGPKSVLLKESQCNWHALIKRGGSSRAERTRNEGRGSFLFPGGPLGGKSPEKKSNLLYTDWLAKAGTTQGPEKPERN